MSIVWTLDLPRHILFFLLTLADHASDDGSNIYPSIRYLSWKTGYSERQIQRLIKILVKDGILKIIVNATHDFPNQYQMSLENCRKKPRFLRGDKKSPPPLRGDKTSRDEVTKCLQRGDVIVSPKTSFETLVKTPPQPSVICPGIPKLLIPKGIGVSEGNEMISKLKFLKYEDGQQLLDELAGRMSFSSILNPLGYLNAMIKKFHQGEFVPELALKIKEKRDVLSQKKQENSEIEAQIQSERKGDKSGPTIEFKEALEKMKRVVRS